ncbi:FecR domain-containing protein [Chitinophaga horti]|uniref:FecR domain-containing protein n=1 Tax=Chitinophaga horti TaxID=2920382 RepID=A0ABY6J3N7_9BACT|nr:FecR family protein [Chitinophaga horti]UYQ94120.1 FecR domain-containing protein [Chitinophaga horti]
MKEADFQSLMEKYVANELTKQEFDQLWTALQEPGRRAAWTAFMHQAWDAAAFTEQGKAAALEQLLPQVRKRRSGVVKKLSWWAAAACMLSFAAGIFYFQGKKKLPPSGQVASATSPNTDIQPGRNRALLTLADGSIVELDSTANGLVGQQGGTNVTKQSNGRLVYEQQGAAAENMYNTMRTPRGGQYQVVLPDGSRVWLNAASAVTYPVSFGKKERKVKISGEVYFEVAANAANPFVVQIMSETGEEKGVVTVLGTRFNINAYDNEGAATTTLLNGAVIVSRQEERKQLQPGQRAAMGKIIEVTRPEDLEGVTAWKDGYFKFTQADIGSVMRQAERWYDIEVLYPKGAPDEIFSGTLPRNVNLTQFLDIMVYSDVKATIRSRQVIIEQ